MDKTVCTLVEADCVFCSAYGDFKWVRCPHCGKPFRELGPSEPKECPWCHKPIETNWKECVGCGYCCLKAQCAVSLDVYGPLARCKALYWNGSMYRCGLAKLWTEELAIGEGCCSSLNTWRQDVRERG